MKVFFKHNAVYLFLYLLLLAYLACILLNYGKVQIHQYINQYIKYIKYHQAHQIHQIIHHTIACWPCNSWIKPNISRVNDPLKCPDVKCLQSISVENVFQRVKEMIDVQ